MMIKENGEKGVRRSGKESRYGTLDVNKINKRRNSVEGSIGNSKRLFITI